MTVVNKVKVFLVKRPFEVNNIVFRKTDYIFISEHTHENYQNTVYQLKSYTLFKKTKKDTIKCVSSLTESQYEILLTYVIETA